MDPLTGVAIGVGVARGVGGIISAGKNARKNRNTIKRAYQISKRRMNEDQGYTRQSVNEDLNRRGVLGAGANTGQSSVIRDAYAQGVTSAASNAAIAGARGVSGKLQALKAGGEGRVIGTENARMAGDAERGQIGDARTLGGQANVDLSQEFYGEHQDLFAQREAAINATKTQQANDTLGAIGSGFEMGANVYSAGKMFGAGKTAAPAGASPSAGGVTIKGAFGIDPVDPLGLNKQSVSGFNFNVGDKP